MLNLEKKDVVIKSGHFVIYLGKALNLKNMFLFPKLRYRKKV